jgi:hypothetical protein
VPILLQKSVDEQIVFRQLLYGEHTGLRTPQNFIHVRRATSRHFLHISGIRQ